MATSIYLVKLEFCRNSVVRNPQTITLEGRRADTRSAPTAVRSLLEQRTRQNAYSTSMAVVCEI
jgi:hypothetical protein